MGIVFIIVHKCILAEINFTVHVGKISARLTHSSRDPTPASAMYRSRYGSQSALTRSDASYYPPQTYELSSEQAYISWVRRFILFHHKRHPAERGADELRAFLTHFAVESHVAASTQNGALNALLFLYRHVLQQPFPDLGEFERAKRPRRLPIVFSQEEVRAVLAQLDGVTLLMARLLYGAGLRLMECVRLRVQDLDFSYHQIIICDGKGAQDRITMP